jgi:WD40 repeat protein
VRGGNTKSVRSIAFSCDGKKLATGTEYKGLRIWNATQPVGVALELEDGAEQLGGTEWELLPTEELRFQSTQWSCRYVHSFSAAPR